MKSKMIKKGSKMNSNQALALLMGVPLLAGILPVTSQAAGPSVEMGTIVRVRSKMGSKETSSSQRAWVDGMPDLDQYRIDGTYLGRTVRGLTGDGRSYCGPTAAANILGWISNTGYELSGESFMIDAAPRASEWTPPSSSASDRVKRDYVSVYNVQTDFIESLATEMGTELEESVPAGDWGGTPMLNQATVIDSRLPSSFSFEYYTDDRCRQDRDDSGRLVDRDLGAMTIYNSISSGSLVLLNLEGYTEGTDVFGKKRWYYNNWAHVEVVTGIHIPKDSSRNATLYTRTSAETPPLAGEMGLSQSQFQQNSYIIPHSEELVQYGGEVGCTEIGKKATVMRFESNPRSAVIITGMTVISPPPGAQFIGFTPTEVVSGMESY